MWRQPGPEGLSTGNVHDDLRRSLWYESRSGLVADVVQTELAPRPLTPREHLAVVRGRQAVPVLKNGLPSAVHRVSHREGEGAANREPAAICVTI